MISAAEYKFQNELLLSEYEEKVRTWLANKADKQLAEKIPFFRDGVVCPEVWFQPENSFRPLFIMKEANIGKKHISELDEYLEKWGNITQFEFVTNEFDDVRVGTFQTWIRIAKLAKGLEDIHNGIEVSDCEKYDMSFKENGKKYNGDIKGYKNDKHHYVKSANTNYDAIINKIAVINFKKIGGGKDTTSEISTATEYFETHIKVFEELLYKQIELINPTVIIRCGREEFEMIEKFKMEIIERLKTKENKDVLWIDGYHPMCWNKYIARFYNIPIQAYQQHKGK